MSGGPLLARQRHRRHAGRVKKCNIETHGFRRDWLAFWSPHQIAPRGRLSLAVQHSAAQDRDLPVCCWSAAGPLLDCRAAGSQAHAKQPAIPRHTDLCASVNGTRSSLVLEVNEWVKVLVQRARLNLTSRHLIPHPPTTGVNKDASRSECFDKASSSNANQCLVSVAADKPNVERERERDTNISCLLRTSQFVVSSYKP